MLRLIGNISVSLLLLTSASAAQPAEGGGNKGQAVTTSEPKPFTNLTIDQTTYEQIRTWLLDQPAKFSLPMLNTLATLEQRAQEAKDAEQKSKAGEVHGDDSPRSEGRPSGRGSPGGR